MGILGPVPEGRLRASYGGGSRERGEGVRCKPTQKLDERRESESLISRLWLSR